MNIAKKVKPRHTSIVQNGSRYISGAKKKVNS